MLKFFCKDTKKIEYQHSFLDFFRIEQCFKSIYFTAFLPLFTLFFIEKVETKKGQQKSRPFITQLSLSHILTTFATKNSLFC